MKEMWINIMDNMEYDKLVFSFKPLKDKYWLNKEQLEFLNSNII